MSYSTFKKSNESMIRYGKKKHPEWIKKLQPTAPKPKAKVSRTKRVPKWQKA